MTPICSDCLGGQLLSNCPSCHAASSRTRSASRQAKRLTRVSALDAPDGAAIPEANHNADIRAEGEPAEQNEEGELEQAVDGGGVDDEGRVQSNAEEVLDMVDGGGVDDGGRFPLNAEDEGPGAENGGLDDESPPFDENKPSSCREIDIDIDDFYADLLGEEDEDEDEEEDDEYLPPSSSKSAPKTKSYHQIFDSPKEFVRSLVEVMDWKKMTIRDVHAALRNQHRKTHGDEKPPFSKSMVERVLEEVRDEATEEAKNRTYPEQGLLHFDEVLVTLGPQHGGRRVEHLVITLTGGGKEYKIGIFEICNGTGKNNNCYH